MTKINTEKYLIYPHIDVIEANYTIWGLLITFGTLIILRVYIIPFIFKVIFPVPEKTISDQLYINRMDKCADYLNKIFFYEYNLFLFLILLKWFLMDPQAYIIDLYLCELLYYFLKLVLPDYYNLITTFCAWIIEPLILDFMHQYYFNILFNYSPFILWLQFFFNDDDFKYRTFFFNTTRKHFIYNVITRIVLAYIIGFFNLLFLIKFLNLEVIII